MYTDESPSSTSSNLPVPVNLPKAYINLFVVHIEWLIERRAEGVPKSRLIALFKQEFRRELPDFRDINENDFDEWLYDRAIYYTSNHPNVAEQWRELYRKHQKHVRAEIDGSTYLIHKFNRLKRLAADVEDADDKHRLALLEQIRKEVEGDTTTVRIEPISDEAIRRLTRQQRQELRDLMVANPTVPPAELLKQIQSPDEND